MNKRLLALVMAIALLLCGCCTCDTQVEQLQQRVTELESQLAAITVTEPSEPATEHATDEFDDMSSFLDKLLDSNKYADWMSVATCENATLDHLLMCAKKCACINGSYTSDRDWAYKIASNLVSNPKFTAEVAMELNNSAYTNVKNLAHQALESLENNK